jgi:hypothetical protein
MKRFLLVSKLVVVTICVSGLAFGANVKVVCKNDPKHDKAMLVKAMKTAKSGDKIVIIGSCAPKGIQASTRRTYEPNLTGVFIYETMKPEKYQSWKFDYEYSYTTSKTTESKKEESKEEEKSNEEEMNHDNTHEEEATEDENATEESASEENNNVQEESVHEESEAADDNGDEDSDSDDGGSDSGDDSDD